MMSQESIVQGRLRGLNLRPRAQGGVRTMCHDESALIIQQFCWLEELAPRRGVDRCGEKAYSSA